MKDSFFGQPGGFSMETQSRLERQLRVQLRMLEQHHSNPVMLVLLVTLGSLMLGLTPIAYVSVFGKTQSQTPVPIAAGEAGVWSVFGEKQDASTGVLRQ